MTNRTARSGFKEPALGPLSSTDEQPVDVRLIGSTSREPEKPVGDGQLRATVSCGRNAHAKTSWYSAVNLFRREQRKLIAWTGQPMRKGIAEIISCLRQLRALAVSVMPVETAIALRVGEVFRPPAALIRPFSRRRQCHEQIIRGYPMTTRATPPFDLDRFLSKLDHGRTIKTYRRGQVIFAQGDVAKATFFIRTGKVKLTVVSASGREAVVGILGPRDFFGVGCLFGHPRRVSTATALTEASIIRIDKVEVTRTLRENSQVCDSFMTNLVSRGLRLREDLIDQLFNPSEKRLARALLLLDNFGKEGSALITDITQETLAEMVGTTRARVNFFMNKFRKLGFIDYDNTGIRVHSSLQRFLPRH